MATITAYFDESGKFKDQPTIAFSGIAGVSENFKAFYRDWSRHLKLNGLKLLTMKKGLNVRVPLSDKRAAKGVTNRLDALMPFAECIRKHLQTVTCVAVDTEAFSKTPEHLRKLWTDNPHFMAFTVALLALLDPLDKEDKLNITCDDEEATAMQMYQMYRRVKLVYSDARKRLCSLCFADDDVYSPLQAADFVASLSRLEARRRFHEEDYEFRPLWEALNSKAPGDNLWSFNPIFCDEPTLARIAAAELKRQQDAKEGHRDRELFPGGLE
jgi:hypothetical protein